MASGTQYLYMESDLNLELQNLRDKDDAAEVGATVTASLYALTTLLVKAGVAVDEGGAPNEVTIPMTTGHGLLVDDVIRLVGTISYDGEHTLTAVAAESITFELAFTAETFIGDETVYVGIFNATGIDLPHVADGNYLGNFPDDEVPLRADTEYYLFYDVDADPTFLLIRKKVKAAYYGGE